MLNISLVVFVHSHALTVTILSLITCTLLRNYMQYHVIIIITLSTHNKLSLEHYNINYSNNTIPPLFITVWLIVKDIVEEL